MASSTVLTRTTGMTGPKGSSKANRMSLVTWSINSGQIRLPCEHSSAPDRSFLHPGITTSLFTKKGASSVSKQHIARDGCRSGRSMVDSSCTGACATHASRRAPMPMLHCPMHVGQSASRQSRNNGTKGSSGARSACCALRGTVLKRVGWARGGHLALVLLAESGALLLGVLHQALHELGGGLRHHRHDRRVVLGPAHRQLLHLLVHLRAAGGARVLRSLLPSQCP